MKRSKLNPGTKGLSSSADPSTAKPLKATKHKITGTSRRVESYNAEYERMRPEILERDKYQCQAGLWDKDENSWCRGAAEHVHHRLPRSQGGANSDDNLVSLCSACHRYIHEHPAWAKALKWLLTRDPDSVKVVE